MTEWIHKQLTKERIYVGPSDLNSHDMINVVRHRPMEITIMAIHNFKVTVKSLFSVLKATCEISTVVLFFTLLCNFIFIFIWGRRTLIHLFWTSGDLCPGFQSQDGFPRLCAFPSLCNGFLRFTSGGDTT